MHVNIKKNTDIITDFKEHLTPIRDVIDKNSKDISIMKNNSEGDEQRITLIEIVNNLHEERLKSIEDEFNVKAYQM